MKCKRKITPRRALKWARRHINRCVLCSSPDLARIGLFVPTHPEHWPGPPATPGTTRSWWYGVCASCARRGLPAVADRFEQLLAAPLN
jgi:hypothetical protein